MLVNLALLKTWMVVGIVVSLVFAWRTDERWGDAPMAALLGPLWFFVALEHRDEA